MKRICYLLFSVLLTSSPAAGDLFGVSAASKEMRAAITELNTTINGLPEKLQNTIGVSIQALAAEVDQTIDKLQDETIPILNDAIVSDIDHTADVVRALAHHLDEIGRQDVAELDAEATARIKQLSAMLVEMRAGMDKEIKGWIEHTRDSVVHVDATAEHVIVRTTARLIIDLVRGVSALLFLVGLLLLGLRLLGRVPTAAITRRGTVEFAAGLAIVGCLLAVSLALAIRPQLLAGAAGRTSIQPRETPCQRLQRQMAQLDQARATGSAELVASTERRIGASRAGCFGKGVS